MTDTEAPSLLPCPFCGGDSAIIRTGAISDRYIRVQCNKCGTSVGETRTKKECVDAWNHRTPPSSALGEEIRKLARGLREKAMKATPGPWWYPGHSTYGRDIGDRNFQNGYHVWTGYDAKPYAGEKQEMSPHRRNIATINTLQQDGEGLGNYGADASHIAACDPPTIIRLCNALLGEGK